MSIPAAVYLDHRGDARVPEGCLVVDSERDFLQHALGSAPIMVRGLALCRWAEAFYAGRGRHCLALEAPVEALRSVVEGVSEAQAQELLAALGELDDDLPKRPHLRDVLRAIYPAGPWELDPSLSHSARWLLFLDEASLPEYLTPFLQAQRKAWHSQAGEDARLFYEIDTVDEARATLRRWLGLDRQAPPPTESRFPLPVPEKWQDLARESWAREVLSAGTGLLNELRVRFIPPELLHVAAGEISRYLTHNTEALSPTVLRQLEPFVAVETVERLRSLCPPPEPGDVPEHLADVVAWFTGEYLPYREWEAEHGTGAARERVARAARQFAEWFLPFCTTALHSGMGQERFAFARAAALQAGRAEHVTLWVVLDGLHLRDASRLLQHLRQEPRLSVTRSEVVLAFVPTITSVCKPALFNGRPPSEVVAGEPVPTFPGARLLRDSSDWAAELARASLGDVFVWSILQPDKAYHLPHNRRSIRLEVGSQLDAVAKRIREGAVAINSELPVRIYIATDHGRLLGSGERRHPVPEGMTSHGRAAWGEAAVSFGPSGIAYNEEADVAYLSRHRFNLSVDCAVALDSDAFLTNDGKRGTEQFPHGGVYPEEVLIPWIELARDAAPLTLRCRLSGNGQADRRAEVRLTIENTSSLELQLQSVRLILRGGQAREIPVSGVARPYAVSELRATLDNWPSETELIDARAAAFVLRPGNSPVAVPAEVALTATQMYKQSLSLEDF